LEYAGFTTLTNQGSGHLLHLFLLLEPFFLSSGIALRALTKTIVLVQNRFNYIFLGNYASKDASLTDFSSCQMERFFIVYAFTIQKIQILYFQKTGPDDFIRACILLYEDQLIITV